MNVAITQNDQIKDEIINDDDSINLLARCAYEEKLDVETIQAPALRIIDAVSFSKNFNPNKLKENDTLMDHLKDLRDKNDKYQDVVVNRLLWKVENEFKFLSKQKQQNAQKQIKSNEVFDEKKAVYQYVRGDHHFDLKNRKASEKFDLMISYCHDDKDICSKIYHRLIASDFYRVSFDRDCLHYSNPILMAEKVEKSTIFLMCFSNKYRNSYSCRLEAEHAQKQKRLIIPVKIDHQYEPTGWLKELIGDEKYVDFTKYEFNILYAQLIDEINRVYEQINKIRLS